MKDRHLFTEVLALNAAVVTFVTVATAIVTGLDWDHVEILLPMVAVTIGFTCLANVALIRRRFDPLEHLINEMERVDLSQPGANLPPDIDGKAEQLMMLRDGAMVAGYVGGSPKSVAATLLTAGRAVIGS